MSAALGNQAGIAIGLSTIATIQSNPQATLAPAQAGAYQQDISGLINALNTMNEQLLSAASSINQTVDGLKLTVCASGVTPGEPNRGFTGFDKGILADAGINPDEEAEEPDYSAVAGGGGTPPTNNGGRPPFVGGAKPNLLMRKDFSGRRKNREIYQYETHHQYYTQQVSYCEKIRSPVS